MKTKTKPNIIIFIYNILFLLIISSLSYASSEYSRYEPIKSFEKIANSKQKLAQEKAKDINRYFNQGKACYRSKRYSEARTYFDKILDIEPSYEPAKLYIECIVIREGILEAQSRIEVIRLKMADIMSEFDRRIKHTGSLAVKYFLEEAGRECQLGNFKAAEEKYNLCYKIYPYSKEKIEWFVEATYDLMDLYKELDKENTAMEKLVASIR